MASWWTRRRPSLTRWSRLLLLPNLVVVAAIALFWEGLGLVTDRPFPWHVALGTWCFLASAAACYIFYLAFLKREDGPPEQKGS